MNPNIMANKILIVTDDAGESYEILYARHRLLEAGYQPLIAATKRKLLNGMHWKLKSPLKKLKILVRLRRKKNL